MSRMHRQEVGFTLVEMMVAMAILVFGLTTLVGVLSVGVDTRRGAERMTRGVELVERIVHRIETEIVPAFVLPDADGEVSADALAIPMVTDGRVAGYPLLAYDVTFETDVSMPHMVLARIGVRWREQGVEQSETFYRLLRRAAPAAVRRAKR